MLAVTLSNGSDRAQSTVVTIALVPCPSVNTIEVSLARPFISINRADTGSTAMRERIRAACALAPTPAINVVGMPQRPRMIAWFVALPPRSLETLPPRTDSPSPGIRSTEYVSSITMFPTTKTCIQAPFLPRHAA